MHDFEYDPFQKQAIEAIRQNHSVLVSAPTGAGKTAIAEYALDRALRRNERVIYTAPIKAISNQKFREFNELFPGRVGILTGDVSIEPHAPLLIMTTEIYRNQLFEGAERHEQTAWVVLDEFHFLDDYERGTVWEEAIMFSKPRTRFVALSATAPNIEEVAGWIRAIHNHPITVITQMKRPVKLVHYFQCQNQIYYDLISLKKRGYQGMNAWHNPRGQHHRRQGRHGQQDWRRQLRAKPNRIDDLLKHLIQKDRLPCLYFAFGRKRVQELAEEHSFFDLMNEDEHRSNRERFDELCEKFDLTHEKSAAEMRKLVERGIAYHHAGLLPTLKEAVERLFTEKRLKFIFTTETFALGINMPARTVVFDELRKFYGFGFDNLTTRDYFQMAGRAGRRGMDEVGYVYSRVNPHMVRFDVAERLMAGKTEPILSQFNASYATLLNLYRQLGAKLVEIYPRSFHHYQSGAKRQKKALRSIERKLGLLESMGYIDKNGLTAKGEFASWMYGYELVLSELWESGVLNELKPVELCVLLASLVFEPRKNEKPVPCPGRFRHLEKICRNTVERIHRQEVRNHVFPPTPRTHFHLAAAMEAWANGTPFHNLDRHTDVDEGIIIRYFRMVIQLLRQLKDDPAIPDDLRSSVKQAMRCVNRGIVDAERLLRNIGEEDTPEGSKEETGEPAINPEKAAENQPAENPEAPPEN